MTDVQAIEVTETRPVGRKTSPWINEFIVYIVVSLLCICAGFVIQWTPPAFVHTDDEGDQPFFDCQMDQVTFLVLAPYVVGAIACPIFGIIAFIYGRKPALYVAAILGAVSGFDFLFADGATSVYIGRITSCVCMAGATTICPLYMIELSRNSTRSVFVPRCILQIFLGILLGGGMGRMLRYAPYCSFLIVIPSLFIFFFFWLPESPYYFVRKSKLNHAELSLIWLRGKEYSKNELNRIESQYDQPDTGLGPALLLYVIKGFGGVYVVQHYIYEISTGKSTVVINTAVIIASLLLASSFLGTLATDRAGRKLLLYLSYAGSSCSFLVVSLYKLFKMENYPLLPLFGMSTSVVFSGIGYGTLTQFVALELIDVKRRVYLSSIGSMLEHIAALIVLVIYPFIDDYLCGSINYMIPAAANMIGVLFTWLVFTETKDSQLDSERSTTPNKLEPVN